MDLSQFLCSSAINTIAVKRCFLFSKMLPLPPDDILRPLFEYLLLHGEQATLTLTNKFPEAVKVARRLCVLIEQGSPSITSFATPIVMAAMFARTYPGNEMPLWYKPTDAVAFIVRTIAMFVPQDLIGGLESASTADSVSFPSEDTFKVCERSIRLEIFCG